MIIKVMSHPKTPLPTSSGSSLQQGKASTESSWTRFLINLVENIGDDDDDHDDHADDHLCRRSLIDPGRWRAPARSSWSPFFIHKSGAQDGLKKSATPDKILGSTILFSHNSAEVWHFVCACWSVGHPLNGTRGYFQRRLAHSGLSRPTLLISKTTPPQNPTLPQSTYYHVLRKAALSFRDVGNREQCVMFYTELKFFRWTRRRYESVLTPGSDEGSSFGSSDFLLRSQKKL